jgi:hypothetical protein
MMAGGVESWSSSSAEGEAKLGMVMEFSLDDGGVAAASFSSSPKLPRRLRRRLSESKTPQKCTVQDIEAKLRHADLRRQVFFLFSFLFIYFFKFRKLKSLVETSSSEKVLRVIFVVLRGILTW